MKEEWSCASIILGALSVMMGGTMLMLPLFVGSWDTLEQVCTILSR